VPEDRRRRRRHVAARAERIGDADVDRGDPDDDLVRLRVAERDLLDHERLPDRVEDCSARGHTV
jgi:hypothetical protein